MAENKTALVTGANKGIGFEVARRLADAGYSVWLGCRDAERGEHAAAELRAMGHDAKVLLLDVTDTQSVASAAATLGEHQGNLDVLVNNAGIALGLDKQPSEEGVDSVRANYEVNVFGVIRVTQAFLPLLRAAPAARIVMVSSSVGSLAIMADPQHPFYQLNELGYATSKTALNAVMVAFAKELADTSIKVNAADPGHTSTDLNGHTGPRSVEQAAGVVVDLATLPGDGPNGGYFNERGPVPW